MAKSWRGGIGQPGLLLAAAIFSLTARGATVVEYLNSADFPSAPGGHFFYSSDPGEQAFVDSGGAGAFKRTGLIFYTGGDTAVCRFYGSVLPGPNSHFFTANAQECAWLRSMQLVPTPTDRQQWNYEGLGFTVVTKPAGGSCPAGTVEVHRAYNNGFARGVDSNHRYSTSRDALNPLVNAAGWVYEGVVFCSELPVGQAPLISEVLSCGTLASAGGLAEGSQLLPLQRHTLDLARFPDAQCNDGTAAVIYFRPHLGDANRNKWIIQLQGGGGCASADDCAKRWCGVDTGFGMTQMTGNVAPLRRIDGMGIMARPADAPQAAANPYANFNQVFLRYCSSDAWSGTARDSSLEAKNPATGSTVRMRAHFLGSRILDAALATLRQDGVGALTYTYGGIAALPNLDAADEVVLAGASAGGAGVVKNLDRIRELLRSTNTRCAGASCPLIFHGLMDSIFAPSMLDLDFSQSTYCRDLGACTPEAFLTLQRQSGQGRLWQPRLDQSCLDLLGPAGLDWRCLDNTYVTRNHITTPFFVRMGLTDELLSKNDIDARLALRGQPPFTLAGWAQKVRSDLLALSDVRSTALERASIEVTPGVFGPACSKHETLRSNDDTYAASIKVGGQSLKMFDLWNNWIHAQAPSSAVSSSVSDAVCP